MADTGFQRMSDEQYAQLYGNEIARQKAGMDAQRAADAKAGRTKHYYDSGDAIKPATSGWKQSKFTDPTPDASFFTDYRPEQMGYTPDGRSLLERYAGTQIDPSLVAMGRQGQMDALAAYRAAMLGQGPSVAQAQLAMAQQQAAQQAGRMALGGHGPSGLSRYMAGQQLGQMGMQGAQQAGLLRAQEMEQARAGMLGASNALRASDMDLASQNAQLAAQAGMFNAGQYNSMLGSDLDRYQRAQQANADWRQQAMIARGQGLGQWAGLASGNGRWTQEMAARQQDMANQYWAQRDAERRQQEKADRDRWLALVGNVGGGIAGMAIGGPAGAGIGAGVGTVDEAIAFGDVVLVKGSLGTRMATSGVGGVALSFELSVMSKPLTVTQDSQLRTQDSLTYYKHPYTIHLHPVPVILSQNPLLSP